MTKNKYHVSTSIVEVDGAYYEVDRINNDVNGNPRYVVHFRDFNMSLDDYQTNRYDVRKYRAKWYGGGILFTTYSIEHSIRSERNRINTIRKTLRETSIILNGS